MRPGLKGFWCHGLVALALATLACPVVAMDDRGIGPGPPRVQVLLIIDRQAGVRGVDVTERNILRLAGALKASGLSGDPIVLDSAVSPATIVDRLRPIDLGGQGALLVYYFGHGGTNRYRGHALGTSGGLMWRSALIEAAQRTRARLMVLLTDACSVEFSAVTSAAGSAVTGFAVTPTTPVGDDTARILSSLLLDNAGLVDINGSTWWGDAATGEFGWNNDGDGALFTSALTRLLLEGRFEQLDGNRDGIVAWSELELPLKTVSRYLYDDYKAGFLNGRYPINAIELTRLHEQTTQTPQFHSAGWPSRAGFGFARVPAQAPVPASGSIPGADDRRQQGVEELAKAFGRYHDSLPVAYGQPPAPTGPTFLDRLGEVDVRPVPSPTPAVPPAPVPGGLFDLLSQGQLPPPPTPPVPSSPYEDRPAVPPPPPCPLFADGGSTPAPPSSSHGKVPWVFDDYLPHSPIGAAPPSSSEGKAPVPSVPPTSPSGTFFGRAIVATPPSPPAPVLPPPCNSFGYSIFTVPPPAPADRPVRLGVDLADKAGFVVIASVVDGSPASRTGMRAGDVILTVNGVSVRSVQEFLQRIDAVPPWGHVRLEGRSGAGWQFPVAYEADLVR